jgi:hypothetical protein
MKGKLRLYRDQYGRTVIACSVRELARRVGGGRVSKMYVDRKDGSTFHIGYVIGRYWLTAFQSDERPA